ncbi:GntR family transcriptional regulator [Reichenbachiella carrageenanivorans]|uniref:GntR family transcriptional regulator n=1 Tax=Reichenbachiella carrageenanivorans TaxID=2979869 RepID=A0ABY6CYU1_9BACT|nr:GntR family transcriptional regulator [Reichenbachiella carrageenanivorans]UXX79082.1 GntR family transcriptional regulator [Reichenbachiella carrageenanivorans]
MQKIIQHSDLSKPVYQELKSMIQEGRLLPGQKLIQEQLAVQLGVSRTPLLKALQHLEHEMLVESIPRRGMYVREISVKEMIDVYDCREAVECLAVKLIIERSSDEELAELLQVFAPFEGIAHIDADKYRKADERFHDLIIELSKNPVLKRMSGVGDVHKRVYQFGLIREPKDTLAEHMKILAAISSRDVARAVHEIRNHIALSKNILLEKQKSKNDKL